MFLSKPLSLLLLGLHLTCLTVFAIQWLQAAKQQTGRRIFLLQRLHPHYIVYTLVVSNFVGIAFARTLHYQFYAWYFHSLPYLLWSSSPAYPLAVRLLVLAGVELAFLTFPATPWSSAILQLCHVAILLQIRPPAEMVILQEDGTKKNK
jgi:alpha-1,3-mannosyltransferase